MTKPFRPTRGGDGGVLPRKSEGWEKNKARVLCGLSLRGTKAWAAYTASLVETDDPDDWAHGAHDFVYDAAGRIVLSLGERLLPARELREAYGEKIGGPRRYPAHQMVGRPGSRVAVDSQFDHAARVARDLAAAGVDLGWGAPPTGDRLRDELNRRNIAGCRESRMALERRTRQDMTPAELALERAASAMLGE